MDSNYTNKVLHLIAPFEPDRIDQKNFRQKLGCGEVHSDELKEMLNQLLKIKERFEKITIIDGVLISVYYKDITPKSSRLMRLLSTEKDSYDTVVGSRFENKSNDDLRHVVTHLITDRELDNTISELKEVILIMDESYNGVFNSNYLEKGERESQNPYFIGKNINKTNFYRILIDSSYVDKFGVFESVLNDDKNKLITFFPCFDSPEKLEQILKQIGVEGHYSILDKCNAILSAKQIQVIQKLAPFLISMEKDDFSFYQDDDIEPNIAAYGRKLPHPDNLPVIGVFDTMYEKGCYLDEYVDFENLAGDLYLLDKRNFRHGTLVDSILIEGNELNKEYDDHCGYFKVKHFGVGGKDNIDFNVLYNQIATQVEKYHDTIKVWNLSLGDEIGVSDNYISLLGSLIDEVSRKYRVLFVVAGTNISRKYHDIKIGSPADSLNALVVNSVISKDNPIPAGYARRGPVLTFIGKPDISYYGGDKDNPLFCYSPDGNYFCHGTSIAAPLVARKAAFLVYKMHLSVELAKTMLINSAVGWNPKSERDSAFYGAGIVPISIFDIIESPKNEIRIVIEGHTKNKYTLIHDFPILVDDETKLFNYTAKLVFCYFTYGDRNHGVDYANQDVSVEFGRAENVFDGRDGKRHYKIFDKINKDPLKYSQEYMREGANIKDLNKWNNTKILMEGVRQQKKPKDYSSKDPLWGIRITHLDRHGVLSKKDWEFINSADDKDLSKTKSVRFGIVATFKTCDGTDANIVELVRKIRANNNYTIYELNIENENRLENRFNSDAEIIR